MNKLEIANSFGLLKTNNQIFVLDKQTNMIGKHPSSNIILTHPSTSRDHALIEFNEKNEGFLKDLNSTNGCYINDVRIKDGSMIKLKNYDKLKFAKDPTIFVFEYNNKENYNPLDITKDNYSIIDEKISLVKNNVYPKTTRNHLAKNQEKPTRFDTNNNNLNNINFKGENKAKSSYMETDKGEDMKMYMNTSRHENENQKNNQRKMNNIHHQMSVPEKESPSPKFNSIGENELYDLNLTFKQNNPNTQGDNNGEEVKIKLYEELHLKIEKLTKINENLSSKNTDLEERILNLTNEYKKQANNFELINEEFNKLNAKHNALLLYASDVQKKVDILELDNQEKQEELNRIKGLDWGRLLIERDNVIKILQTDVSFYKNELNSIKSNLLSSQKLYGNDLSKRMDSLLENYMIENKKNKKILDEYKSRENECNKKWNELLKENNLNIEKNNLLKQQLVEQNNQFNKTISDFDKRLLEALSKIPRFLENFDQKKSEAAQYLVDEVNIIMDEKRRLVEDNTILNNKIGELSFELDKIRLENKNYYAYFDNTSPINSFTSNINQPNNVNLKFMKNKIEELEDMLSQYKNNCSPNKIVELEEALGAQYEKLSEKDKLIESLQVKLKEYLKKNNVVFDEKQAVVSLTKALREKDIMIINLKAQVKEMRDIDKVKALEIDNLSRIAEKHYDNNTNNYDEFNNVKEKGYNPSIFIEKVENLEDFNHKIHNEIK